MDFDREYIESIIALSNMDILTLWILPVHNLFVSSSISFISVLVFSVQILVEFISSYIILFNAFVNEIVFLLSLHSYLLLYRNEKNQFLYIDFVSWNFTDSFINSCSFSVVFRIFCI